MAVKNQLRLTIRLMLRLTHRHHHASLVQSKLFAALLECQQKLILTCFKCLVQIFKGTWWRTFFVFLKQANHYQAPTNFARHRYTREKHLDLFAAEYAVHANKCFTGRKVKSGDVSKVQDQVSDRLGLE